MERLRQLQQFYLENSKSKRELFGAVLAVAAVFIINNCILELAAKYEQTKVSNVVSEQN